MRIKFVALNDFFHPVQHLLHPLLIIKNNFAAENFHFTNQFNKANETKEIIT